MSPTIVRRAQVEQARIRTATVAEALRIWSAVGGVTEQDRERFVTAVRPVVRAGQQMTVDVTAALTSQLAGGSAIGGPSVDALALRGVDPVDVYSRPVVTARTGLSQGKAWTVAMREASQRLDALVATDIQIAKREAARDIMTTDQRIVGYRRVLTGNSCALCATASTQRYRTGDLMPIHSSCVIGETPVSATRIDAVTRRWYQGEAVVIGTTSGNELTVTPNHPVLTGHGWVPAGLISEGDDMIRSTRGQRVVGRVPHEHEVPTGAEDRFGAFAVTGLVSMPLTAEAFHGDVPGGQVGVVTPDRLLWDDVEAACGEHCGELAFTFGIESPGSLSTQGDAFGVLLAQRLATHGIMSGGGLALALGGRHARCTHLARRAVTADRHACGHKMAPNDVAVDSILAGERQFAGTFEIAGGEFLDGQLDAAGAKFDAPAAEFSGEGLALHADRGRRLLDRLSGQVELDRVVFVRRVDLASTHVFNLHTAEGWYSASGLIVSNCDCEVVPIVGDRDPGQIINQDLLRDLQSEGGPGYWNDRGLSVNADGQVVRLADESPLEITEHVHGELGPVIADAEHAFAEL